MDIITSANNQYVEPLNVMLKSLLINLSKPREVTIFILHSDLFPTEQIKLQELVQYFQANITFIKVVDDTINRFALNPELPHIHRETYFRIEIPNLLPPNIEKALYLDCDIVILDDLQALWATEMADYYVAAVADFQGIANEREYFNAGVLLLNLKKWRNDGISRAIKKVLMEQSDKFPYMDQDALNAVLQNNILPLELKWNYQSAFWKHHLLNEPSILHFTGPEKPWNASTAFNGKYDYYLNLPIQKIRQHTC